MVALALDTTTRTSSCALARDGVVIHECVGDGSQPQATRLPNDLMSLLDQAGVPLTSIDIYAVAIGPGSFTGLRVGIATMQGLAFAEKKPLIGVSGFDALATIAGGYTEVGGSTEQDPPYKKTRVATWVDAWRGEVYAALYADGREIEAPVVSGPERVLARLAGAATVFIGDGAEMNKDLITRVLGRFARFADPTTPALAGTIARMATDMARAGHRPPPHAIGPLYVRRSDAELARDARATH